MTLHLFNDEKYQNVLKKLEFSHWIYHCLENFNYCGYVEGNDISLGKSHVVVTDGFTGNIALKAAEGTARLIEGWLRDVLTRSALGKVASLILKLGPLKTLKSKMDPRSVNGGVFLGLNGIVVKSHGNTDGLGFSNALHVANKMAKSGYIHEIEERLNFAEKNPTV